MITLNIHYSSQIAILAQVHNEEVELENNTTVETLLKELAQRHGKSFEELIFDKPGTVRRNIIFSMDNEQITNVSNFKCAAHHRELVILTPMAGG